MGWFPAKFLKKKKKKASPATKPFPKDVYRFMKTNANPQMALKLMQVNTFFQHRTFPYYYCEEFDTYTAGHYHLTFYGYRSKLAEEGKIPDNLWITKHICLWNFQEMSTLAEKIVVCSISRLQIGRMTMTWNEFNILSSAGNIEEFCAYEFFLIDDDNEVVPLEMVLQFMPNVTRFDWVNNVPSFSSCRAVNPKFFGKLKEFCLYFISGTFNLEALLEFLDFHKHAKFVLNFEDAFFKKELRKYIYQIYYRREFQWPVPSISYPGQPTELVHCLKILSMKYDWYQLAQQNRRKQYFLFGPRVRRGLTPSQMAYLEPLMKPKEDWED